MAKIIPFPAHGNKHTEGQVSQDQTPARTEAGRTPSPKDSRILMFVPGGPEIAASPTLQLALGAGIDPAKGLDKDAPEWARQVHLSRWWRLSAVLVDELAQGPAKPDGAQPFNEAILLRLRMAHHDQGLLSDDAGFAKDLEEVLWILQDKAIVAVGKRGMSLEPEALELADHPWVLWAELFDAGQNGRPWVSAFHKKLGPYYQTQISKSLGLIRAAAAQGSITAPQLMEFADLNFEFELDLADLGIQLPRSEEAFKSRNRPGIVEKEWYRLLVQDFAVPMGLVEIDADSVLRTTTLLEQL